MTIHVLPPEVAAKIAAGEVVERPANVAKELLENSLDAGATELRVEIREGGQRLLRVIDNGHGMTADEAPLAFLRHATSKLNTVDDLDRIATFGFRGEALYSIAAVSQVTLTTRHQSENFGVQLRIEGGHLVAQQRAGTPVGTVLSVEHLFYNVPARQKFLRKATTEAGQISEVVQRYALAHPDRRFSLVVDGRLVFQSNGNGDLLDVLTKIYGLENARQMAPVGEESQRNNAADSLLDNLSAEVDFMGERASNMQRTPTTALQVSGYASLPSLTRANRSNIAIFVNRRYVEDRNVTYAVVQAYHTLLPVGRYPIAVIMVEVDPAQVDVNVHPQKTQVRFVDDRMIFAAVQKAVRQAVVTGLPAPEIVIPGPLAEPRSFASGAGSRWGETVQWEAPQDKRALTGQPSLDMAFPEPPLPAVGSHPAPMSAPPSTLPSTGSTVKQYAPILGGRNSQLPPLRVVGQIGATYIITEGPEGMYLIDQHAAHERILYEKLMAERAAGNGGQVARQHLLDPLTLHVGSTVAGMVAQYLEDLRQVGYEIDAFGGDTFLVRAIPSVLAGEDPLRNLEEMVQTLADRRNLVGEALEARLVKLICKRAAIKAGQLLSDLEMQELVRQLEECQSPRTCPHGRPTLIQLSANELEKAFGRV
jgi:DNA mismatch repair protein MutL